MQRIESARRLVEDEQGRLWREREEQCELLLVAVRVLAVLAAEVEIEPLRDSLDLTVRDIPAQARDIRHDLRATPAAELRQLAGDIPDLVFQRDRIAVGVEPEGRGGPPGGMDQLHQEVDRLRLFSSRSTRESGC